MSCKTFSWTTMFALCRNDTAVLDLRRLFGIVWRRLGIARRPRLLVSVRSSETKRRRGEWSKKKWWRRGCFFTVSLFVLFLFVFLLAYMRNYFFCCGWLTCEIVLLFSADRRNGLLLALWIHALYVPVKCGSIFQVDLREAHIPWWIGQVTRCSTFRSRVPVSLWQNLSPLFLSLFLFPSPDTIFPLFFYYYYFFILDSFQPVCSQSGEWP